MNKNKPTDSVVLECREVVKDYEDANTKIKVLTGVSLSVQRGEQIAIMGRSGSGKTTLLQMLGGLDAPSSGEIWINGQNLHKMSERHVERLRNQSLGFIYQLHHLLPEFTAIENVAMPLLIGNIKPSVAAERAIALLEAVGLKNRLNHHPAELSGGERQRVAIARALVNQPSCVLADEPTGNLDDKNAQQVLEVMQTLNRTAQTSLIIVTHDPALATKMDRTLVLHGGQLEPL
jgi:lipoprotein-releasing system ATP-binding protein